MQRVPIAAAKLGVPRGRARALARVYFTEVYPEDRPEYQTPGCRNGRAFDLRPRDAQWP
jgi:hypothetical protein